MAGHNRNVIKIRPVCCLNETLTSVIKSIQSVRFRDLEYDF